jgi:hypothetical protein
VLERAMVLHAIDVAADDPIVLAKRISSFWRRRFSRTSRSARAGENVTGAAVVTDTGSTKRAIVEARASLPIA